MRRMRLAALALAVALLALPTALANHPPEAEKDCNLHDDYPWSCAGWDPATGHVCVFYDPGDQPPFRHCTP